MFRMVLEEVSWRSIHRTQVTFDWVDVETGEGARGKLAPANASTIYDTQQPHCCCPPVSTRRSSASCSGNTDIGITLNLYSHVIPGLQERAAAAFDELLAPSRPEEPPADAYDGPAPAAAALAVYLAVRSRSSKATAQVSPRSSGDRASVS